MDWERLKTFHAVARAGSLAAASKALNLSQPALSRRIALLEEELGVKLFHRHARGLLLTEQGELLYRTAKEMAARAARAEVSLGEARDLPRGPLKVTTSVPFGIAWLTWRLAEFIEAYPDVAVELLVDDRELDLTMREADVAVRMNPPRQPDLIRRRLMTVHYYAYATRQYLDAFGEPLKAMDLDRHRLIALRGGQRDWPSDLAWLSELNWLLTAGRPHGEPRRPVLATNNLYGVYQAVAGGLGIAPLPDYMACEVPGLVRVLGKCKAPTREAYFIYPEELRHSRRIQVFRDFILEKLAEQRRVAAAPGKR